MEYNKYNNSLLFVGKGLFLFVTCLLERDQQIKHRGKLIDLFAAKGIN